MNAILYQTLHENNKTGNVYTTNLHGELSIMLPIFGYYILIQILSFIEFMINFSSTGYKNDEDFSLEFL
jgi:hypothetical protein